MHPLSKLPADPVWVKKVDELAEKAADELGCMVILVAIQENGKLGITAADNDPEGQQRALYKEIGENMPKTFLNLAKVCAMYDALAKQNPQ